MIVHAHSDELKNSIDSFKKLQKRNKSINGAKYVFSPLGATSHSHKEREEDDYYATPPKAVKQLCKLENFSHEILEPCCGEGHISKVLIDLGYDVESSDLVNRGYGDKFCSIMDLEGPYDKDIITNPPYKYSLEFAKKCLSLVADGHKVALFLRLHFLETSKRYYFFKQYPIKTVYVSSNRLGCAKNGEFDLIDKDGELNGTSAVCFAWFVWEKGYKGKTTLDFFNFD